MAGRTCMCLFRTGISLYRKLQFSNFSQTVVKSQFHAPKTTHNLMLTLCRRYSGASVLSYTLSSNVSKSSHGQRMFSSKTVDPAFSSQNPTLGSQDDVSEAQKKQKEDEFRKRTMKYTFIAFGACFAGMIGLLVYEWGSPQRDKDGNIIEDEFSKMSLPKAYVLRTYREMMYYDKMIKEPSREKLLPEPLTEPYYQPPYTLVLEMTDILVHPDWTYKTGWRFKKRPGVDYFLQQIGPPLFEVVIYTSEQGFTAYPILDTLDPNGYIMYRLFRDSTRYIEGHHVKDLSCLNRDLSKVIYVDWNSKSFSLQPNNALMVKKWAGDDEDRALYDLAALLRTIGTSEVDDVRTVLEYYSQFDDPITVFKENQKKLQEEEQKRMKESKGKASTLVGAYTSGLRGRR